MFERLRRLWKLSEYEIQKVGEKIQDYPAGTTVVQNLIKKPTQKARFIPRIKIDPIKEITQEQ